MCLDDQILNTYLDGELSEPWKTQVKEHLSYCSACNTRFQQLTRLHNTLWEARLEESEIEKKQEHILQFMDKNYLEKRKKIGLLRRQVHMKMPVLISAAAVFVLLFVGSFFLRDTKQFDTVELIPTLHPTSSGAVMQVRATEGIATTQILESISLEEILRYLHAKGYQVDLRFKGIEVFGTIQESEPFETQEQ